MTPLPPDPPTAEDKTKPFQNLNMTQHYAFIQSKLLLKTPHMMMTLDIPPGESIHSDKDEYKEEE